MELHARRDRIAEGLFSCLPARCHGCDKVRPQLLREGGEEAAFVEGGTERGGVGDFGCVGVENKFSSEDDGEEEEDVNRGVGNYGYGAAEALTEEMEEGEMFGEVMSIKEILDNKEFGTESQLFELLRKLQLMAISVGTLKATEIGKSVNALRRHASKEICYLVRTLVDGWKVLVDEWVSSATALTENTPGSANPSVVDDEEGLPSPPLDEGFLLSTQTTMELSQFFDGMDDDGNAPNRDGLHKGLENGRNPSAESHSSAPGKWQVSYQWTVSKDKGQMRKQEALDEQAKPQGIINKQTRSEEPFSKQRKPRDIIEQNRHLGAVNKQNKLSSSCVAAGPGTQKMVKDNAFANDAKLRQGQDHVSLQKKPLINLHDKCKNPDEMIACAKLEAAKRKLHEGYQQAESAKKQRTIPVMELHDLPKQRLTHRQPFQGQGNDRFWANGHR